MSPILFLHEKSGYGIIYGKIFREAMPMVCWEFGKDIAKMCFDKCDLSLEVWRSFT